jgi:hypothetical protein
MMLPSPAPRPAFGPPPRPKILPNFLPEPRQGCPGRHAGSTRESLSADLGVPAICGGYEGDNRFMETRELPSRWSDYARRLPSSLKDLSGPATGTIVLPLHVAWSGRRSYDVTDERQRLLLYALLLAEPSVRISSAC